MLQGPRTITAGAPNPVMRASTWSHPRTHDRYCPRSGESLPCCVCGQAKFRLRVNTLHAPWWGISRCRRWIKTKYAITDNATERSTRWVCLITWACPNPVAPFNSLMSSSTCQPLSKQGELAHANVERWVGEQLIDLLALGVRSFEVEQPSSKTCPKSLQFCFAGRIIEAPRLTGTCRVGNSENGLSTRNSSLKP